MSVIATVIVPAHDEAATLARGLRHLAAQRTPELQLHIIVVANGCSDDTAEIGRSRIEEIEAAGVTLEVLEIPNGSKSQAMNRGDEEARGDIVFYCDADVDVQPGSLAAMARALETPGIELVSSTQRLVEPRNPVVRGWARCYHSSPYQRGDDVVHGLFGTTMAARRRIGPFPETMADDRWLTLSFPPAARRRVAAAAIAVRYTESTARLIDQQSRWVANNADIDDRFPELRAANAPAHVARRRPYFVPRPRLFDAGCFLVVAVIARWRARWARADVLSRWDRARPD